MTNFLYVFLSFMQNPCLRLYLELKGRWGEENRRIFPCLVHTLGKEDKNIKEKLVSTTFWISNGWTCLSRSYLSFSSVWARFRPFWRCSSWVELELSQAHLRSRVHVIIKLLLNAWPCFLCLAMEFEWANNKPTFKFFMNNLWLVFGGLLGPTLLPTYDLDVNCNVS